MGLLYSVSNNDNKHSYQINLQLFLVHIDATVQHFASDGAEKWPGSSYYSSYDNSNSPPCPTHAYEALINSASTTKMTTIKEVTHDLETDKKAT